MATKEAFQKFLRYHTDDEVLINQITADCPRQDSLHLDMALKYFDLGWSIIPVKTKSKQPLITWKKYQHQLPSRREVRTWWRENPEAGIGVVLGKISGVFCVDVDGDQGEQILKKVGIDLESSGALTQQTPRGRHYFFAYPQDGILQRNFEGGEVRSSGHYVNVYPSIHPSGTRYSWIQSPFTASPVEAPVALLDFAKSGSHNGKTERVSNIILKGERNNELTRLAGSMRRPGMTGDEIFESLVTENNNRCQPPLPEKEVRNIAHSIGKHEPQETTTSNSDIQLVNLSTVQSEDVEFLWHPRIPLGKVTLIEGDPGVGKSWLTVAIATAVSLGRGLPDCESSEPGNVLMLSAEDGLSDTIKPRLESFGANCKRISAPSEPFTLDPKGFNLLSQFIEECSPRLVIIDPLVAYMGGKVDLHKANETRSIMSQIAHLAERYKCAIVAVRHLTKSSRNKSIYRGLGSIDITAACRSVLLVGCDANNPNERAVVHIKSNLAKLAAPIGYGIDNGKFYWKKESSITAEDILAIENGEGTSIDEAKDFLKQLLADEAVEAKMVSREAKENSIHERTLYRAKKQLGIKSKREDNKWHWYLERHI